MKRATCIRGALLMVLLALTSFASIPPQASAFPYPNCSDPGYPATCCRCINRCTARYESCLAAATTPAQELACYNEVMACDNSCFNGIACGNGP